MHRGIRLRKVTTRRTQTPPSVAASTLAQAFKVAVKPLRLYQSYLYIGYTCIHKFLFVVTANQCIGKNQEPRCRCPPVQPAKEEGHQGNQGCNKMPESGNSSSPPASPIPVESSPSPPDVEIQQAPSPPRPQEVPEVDKPQQEEPQAEGTSADVGEQTTGSAGSITSSSVPPIQTSIVPPQGNIFL